VIERYYPDIPPPQLPPLQTDDTPAPVPSTNTDTVPVFDAAAAMHETRVTVDELLAAGNIEEAEAYMESRRRMFYENGYRIRRLNQAFFAFYGGYQSGGGFAGSGGADPIGQAVRVIWEASTSPQEFVQHLRGITTREQLLALQQSLESSNLFPESP
jgi:hypothetical protein